MGHVVNALSTRYRKALSGAMLSSAAFESIDVSASPECVEAWTAEEERAQRERAHDVTLMDIYDIKMKRRESDQSMIVLPNIRLQSRLVQKYFSS
jgi:hypothetical protein